MAPMVVFIMDGLLVVTVETGREVFISFCFTVADRLQFKSSTSNEIQEKIEKYLPRSET